MTRIFTCINAERNAAAGPASKCKEEKTHDIGPYPSDVLYLGNHCLMAVRAFSLTWDIMDKCANWGVRHCSVETDIDFQMYYKNVEI